MASIRGRIEAQLTLMKTDDKLSHSSVITAFKASTFGREILFVLLSKMFLTAKSRGFTSGEDDGSHVLPPDMLHLLRRQDTKGYDLSWMFGPEGSLDQIS
uniref:Uncharacterized protein n=1 Tax=Lepeophtheirus salmonis TaxID=72036 RepID=A0A0K2V0U8_LEPSM